MFSSGFLQSSAGVPTDLRGIRKETSCHLSFVLLLLLLLLLWSPGLLSHTSSPSPEAAWP